MNNNSLDWDTVISPNKRALVLYLRSRLEDVAATVLQPTTLLPELRVHAMERLKNGKVKPMTSHNFYHNHVTLLDTYDQAIILHLATWHLSEIFLDGPELNWQVGLGGSILAYMAIGWYLNISEQQAYDFRMSDRLVLPKTLAEEAWDAIRLCMEESSMRTESFKHFQSWFVLENTHRVLDYDYIPHRVTILPDVEVSSP